MTMMMLREEGGVDARIKMAVATIRNWKAVLKAAGVAVAFAGIVGSRAPPAGICVSSMLTSARHSNWTEGRGAGPYRQQNS